MAGILVLEPLISSLPITLVIKEAENLAYDEVKDHKIRLRRNYKQKEHEKISSNQRLILPKAFVVYFLKLTQKC